MASISSNESSGSEPAVAGDPRSLGEIWFNLMDRNNNNNDTGSNWAMTPSGSSDTNNNNNNGSSITSSSNSNNNNKPMFLEVASSSSFAGSPQRLIQAQGGVMNQYPTVVRLQQQHQQAIQQQQQLVQSSVTSSSSCSGDRKHEASSSSATKSFPGRSRDSLSECSNSTSNRNNNDNNNEEDDDDTHAGKKRRKRSLSESKRVERNMREQARSNRLTEQFAELRDLLVKAGIVVPKGTKGSILAIAGDYIRVLEQKRSSTEAECAQLRQQVSTMSQAYQGIPTPYQQAVQVVTGMSGMPTMNPDARTVVPSDVVTELHYRAAFDQCPMGIAIATLGGTLLDGNRLFCQLTHYDKAQLHNFSVFNLTAQDQLAFAFERLSELLADPVSAPAGQPQQQQEETAIHVRSSIPTLSLKITLLDPYASLTPSNAPADCRKRRLLITLIEPCHSITSSSSQALVTALFHPAAFANANGSTPDKQDFIEGPSPLYATG